MLERLPFLLVFLFNLLLLNLALFFRATGLFPNHLERPALPSFVKKCSLFPTIPRAAKQVPSNLIFFFDGNKTITYLPSSLQATILTLEPAALASLAPLPGTNSTLCTKVPKL